MNAAIGWLVAGVALAGSFIAEALFTRLRRLRADVERNRVLIERILDRLPPER